jgi:hypothetical protein
MSKHNGISYTWFGVITTVRDDCGKGDADAIILGKEYPLSLDASGCIYFIDEDGEKNYGCDNEDDSSYEFYRTEV